MDAAEAKPRFSHRLLVLASSAILVAAGCTPQAAAPTAAPAKPVPTSAPANTEVPAPRPAATAAPAAKPTQQPTARPAGFDEKAVADFYRGKTIRIVVGYAPGGAADTYARLLQRVLSRYVPGNPTIVVENKPGGGSMLAANTVYNSEPKDGTVIGAFSETLILQQAIGAQGVQFDSTRYNWLGSSYESFGACAARTDSGITGIQDILEGGQELVTASFGKGTTSYNPPAVMNAALGTRFKLVTGYEGSSAVRLAVKNKEAPGFCSSFADMSSLGRELLEGSSPLARILVVMGSETPSHPLLKGVPAAETLARTEEAKALLKAVHAPFLINITHAVAPEVPSDRVQALRRARDRAYADPEFLAAAEKAQLTLSPKTGEEVTRIAQAVLSTPPAMLAKLRQVLE